MKYIKQFEKRDPIWLVRTDEPYFSASLDKLDIEMEEDVKKNILKYNYDEIYIKKYSSITRKHSWGWSDDYNVFDKNHITNMGELELTDKEIDDFLTNQNVEKYNL